VGAGQIGLAIVRRMAFGKKILVADKRLENAEGICQTLNEAGFDAEAFTMDLSCRADIQAVVARALELGDLTQLVCAAGVSPSQAPIETILKVDLYGTAVLLEEVGKVIANKGVGVVISSQSGHRLPALTPEEDRQLATTPTKELLAFPLLQPDNIHDTSWPSEAT
jgi:NAD(P)-dependent dehydrogenase (short-subunit alcohol dehydrogenase family)